MISDFHNDFPTNDNFKSILNDYNQTDNIIVGAIFGGKRSFDSILSISNYIYNMKGKNVFIAYEDIGYINSLEHLQILLQFKPCYVTLCWNNDNKLCGGASGNGYLTEFGKQVIKILNKNKIAVDLAHTNENSFVDIYNLADKIVCSHTCFSGVRKHFRNLSDWQLKLLNLRNAPIGLALYKDFLTENENCDIGDVLKAIYYFTEKFGITNLCLGTDFYGCQDLPKGFSENYSFEGLLTEKLLEAGYTKLQIDYILYRTLKEYLEK